MGLALTDTVKYICVFCAHAWANPSFPADIGACESIMKKKTRQDFQELIKTEHGKLGLPGYGRLPGARVPAAYLPARILGRRALAESSPCHPLACCS